MTDLRAQCQAAYQKKVQGTLVDAVRAVALDASAGVVLGTPVKSGRARANWNVGVNRIDYTVSGRTTMADIGVEVQTATASLKLTDTFYLTNNLPYIRRLNNGYSKQAPAMFVEKAVLAAKNRAKRRIKTEVRG